MGNLDRIGSSIRSLRKSRKMTLQKLAKETGLSTGYLSNIERNITSPTLMNIQKICEVFNSSLGDLLERNAEEKIIIRREDRDITIDEEHSMRIETIDFGIENASFLVSELPPMSETSKEWWTHEFGEVGTVIDGELTMDIDGEVFELKTGDSVYVKAHTRHCYYNKSETNASVSYWSRIWDVKEEDSE
ncbi:helix-turn-helix domain-containing protein [Ruminococcus sp. OA3]|uniref:helix-turn-helix domain-containing protein n=1 Tax=Ruminococcus sp. OA3 TaxID=2914164 RepID=UPI001F060FA1|nr:helix-turn-helix domain-containing protein [Ruminococcus sp. OA3]